jgi:UbiD family decarboxylase
MADTPADAPVLRDLRALLALLERERELVTIDAEVDPALELAEIHRRVIAAQGPALLFRRVKGSPYPVVTNLFGTTRRVGLAFGARPQAFVRQAAALPQTMLPPTPGRIWKQRSFLMQGLRIGMKRSGSGPVTEVVDEPARLGELPLLKLWPEDGGHFVTLPLVYTERPGPHDSAHGDHVEHNLGMYRVQRYDDTHTGIHWQIGKGGGFHHQLAEARGEALPLSITVGGPPALILSAIAPLPEGVPELMLASLLLGEKLPLVNDARSPHPLVGRAEFVLSGVVPPHVRRPEGPFGDHYGYYSLTHDYPVFECKRVFHRKDAIWPATVVGKPRQEDFFIGEYLQELLSPLFPVVMPTVRDLWSYGETGFHALSAAVVKERYPREALVSAFRVLGEGQLSLTKFLLVTDAPLDLKDFRAVLTHILARIAWPTDLYVFSNSAMDTLDYAGPEVNKGSKGVMLGVGPAIRELPQAWQGAPPEGFSQARAFCPGALVVSGPRYPGAPAGGPNPRDDEAMQRLAADPRLAAWPFVAVVDDAARATSSVPAFLWTVFTRFEPANDLHARAVRVQRHHLAYEGPIVLDARMKPWYPKIVEAAPETEALVARRWSEYFPAGGVEMGDARAADVVDG